MEHLLIPGLGLAFVTSRPGMDYGQKPYRRVRLDAMATSRRAGPGCGSRPGWRACCGRRASPPSGRPRPAHDALEAVYNPYVDFDGVRALAALEAGRLLSYLG